MEILNLGIKDFSKTTARQMFIDIYDARGCIDFSKVDLGRPRNINIKILQLFDQFINSPGLEDILLWYKSQNSLLYIYKDAKTGRLKFYGCNRNVEHHSSNIKYIVETMLHKILWDWGSKKSLIDTHSLALVGFGFMSLVRTETTGNIFQGHDTKYYCNVDSFQINLSTNQVELARNILRLCKMR